MKRRYVIGLSDSPSLVTLAQAGRWITRDPMDIPEHLQRDPHPFLDLNPYTFVGNNPIGNIDPFGLDYYVVYVKAFSGYPHQAVVGDNGSGGSYEVDYGPATGGLNRIYGPGKYNETPRSLIPPSQLGYDLSKARCVKTSPFVDKALNNLAEGLGANYNTPNYCFLGNNCWSTDTIFDNIANNYQNFGTSYQPINTRQNLPPLIIRR